MRIERWNTIPEQFRCNEQKNSETKYEIKEQESSCKSNNLNLSKNINCNNSCNNNTAFFLLLIILLIQK